MIDIKRINEALVILEQWYSSGSTQFIIHLNDKNVNYYHRQKLKFKTMGLIQHDRHLIENMILNTKDK